MGEPGRDPAHRRARRSRAWSGVLTWVLLKLIDAMAGMRVAGEEETEGLDTVLHNEKGYNL